MNTKLHLEIIYDTYSSMMYSIAFELSHNQKTAEQILINSFHKFFEKHLIEDHSHCICASLIKLVIQSAREQINSRETFKLSLFENSALLQKIICGNNLDEYLKNNKLTKDAVSKLLRNEFNSFRDNTIPFYQQVKSN